MLFSLATSLLSAVRSIFAVSVFAWSFADVWPKTGSFQTISPPIKAPQRNTIILLSIDTPPAEIGAPKNTVLAVSLQAFAERILVLLQRHAIDEFIDWATI